MAIILERQSVDSLTKQLLWKMEIPLGNSFMPNNDSLNVLVYLVPESPQALTRTKYDWLEMARGCNLGAPRAMTTVVANSRTSEILAHVAGGACSEPDPDFTIMSLFSKADRGNTLSNVAIQTASYLRRRHEFESVAYRAGYDALRGRVDDRTRRRENQKRGPNHDHYCEFHEKCGLIFSAAPIPALETGASSSTTTSPVQQRNRQVIGLSLIHI